jgi:hypothetical protein
MIDEKKLQQLLGKMIVDLGAAISVPLVRIGMRLGLYKAMNGAGPMSSAEFAKKANISERYAREWLAQNAVHCGMVLMLVSTPIEVLVLRR